MSPRQTSADGRFRRVPPRERRGLPGGKRIVTAAIAVLLGLVALFGSGGWMVARQEAAAVAELDAELALIEAELNETQARTSALLEPGGFELERVAREEYLMRAEGDEVIDLLPAGEGAERPDRSR